MDITNSDITTGFTQLFNQMLNIFKTAYVTGGLIWDFLSTPLEETYPGTVEVLGEIGLLAPLEFMIGAGLVYVIIYAMIKFFLPF